LQSLNVPMNEAAVKNSLLVTEIEKILNAKLNFPKEEHPTFQSVFEPDMEYHLQKDVFVEYPKANYQTRSQSIVIKPKKSSFVYYLFRHTEPSNFSDWTVFTVPVTK